MKLKNVELENVDNLLRVKRIIYDPKPCNGCDKIVEQRTVNIRKYVWPQPHWRKKCCACNRWQHPETKKFTIDNNIATSFFSKYFKKKDK